MADTTTDLDISLRGSRRAALPVKAAVSLLTLQLVCIDTSGRAVNGADTANLQFAGLAVEAVDNTDGEDGEATVELVAADQALLTGAGFTAADVGKPVFVDDNQTIALADDVANHVLVGTIVEYVSATQVWVKLKPFHRTEPRVFAVEVAGVNAAALNLATAAALYGGSDFYVKSVISMRANVTSTAAVATANRKVVTTNFTVASGVITTVTDESLNTLLINFVGYLL